jgi:hypothetical protein
MTCVVDQILEDGEWATLEWRDPLGLRGCGFFQIVGGRIIHQRGYWDRLSFQEAQQRAAGSSFETPPVPLPRPDEYASFYAGYVEAVAGSDLWAILQKQKDAFETVFGALNESKAMARYAPGKWSVREVLGHLTDSERVFGYRALRISRGDRTPLPGFDENAYVAAAGFDRRPTRELLKEWSAVRDSTTSLLSGVEPDAWERRTLANDTNVSLRALAYIIAGHVHHHQQVLRDRYGLAFPPP